MSEPFENPAALRALLQARGLAPSKRFGQHFLIEPRLLDAIAGAAKLGPGDVVLEVGPGTGTLTRRLLDRAARVISVEIDAGLHRLVAETLGADPKLDLLHADVLGSKTRLADVVVGALDAALAAVPGATFKVVANLPYNISTPFLAALALRYRVPETMVLLVQKELAQGLASPPGTREYSPIAVLLQSLGRIRTERTVGRDVFWPRPEVESAVVVFERTTADPSAALAVYPLVAHLFSQRRKTIGALLRKLPGADGGAPTAAAVERALTAAGLTGKERAEALTPAAFFSLKRALEAPEIPRI